jgi:hypothetical protein
LFLNKWKREEKEKNSYSIQQIKWGKEEYHEEEVVSIFDGGAVS